MSYYGAAVSRSSLLVTFALVTLVACACAPSPPPGSASAVVTYVDDSGEQRVEVTVDNAACDTHEPRALGTADEQIVVVAASSGETSLRVRIGDELYFLAQTTATTTPTGIQLEGVPGSVVRSGISGTQTRVSSEATASATVVCPG